MGSENENLVSFERPFRLQFHVAVHHAVNEIVWPEPAGI